MKNKNKHIFGSIMTLLLLTIIIIGNTNDFGGNDDDGWHSETNIIVEQKVKF